MTCHIDNLYETKKPVAHTLEIKSPIYWYPVLKYHHSITPLLKHIVALFQKIKEAASKSPEDQISANLYLHL